MVNKKKKLLKKEKYNNIPKKIEDLIKKTEKASEA
jgi:hypothetical protein